jgi:hypothetical protein
MHLSLGNFLSQVKNIVTGGGRTTNGQIKNDAGFLVDMPMSLQDLSNDSVATNAAKQTVLIPLGSMALLANGQTFELPVPFAFTINSVTFRDDVAITTGAKAATLTTKINTTALTGGVVSVAGTYATGATQAGTAVTATNTGVAGDLINIAVSAVTAFVEGTGHVEVSITNNDLAKLFTLSAAETNLKVVNVPASNTSIGSITFVVPRDYDEATDTLDIKLGVAMSGSTDTPSLSAAAFRKRPGSNIATIGASIAGKDITQTSTLNLSTTEQLVYFRLSQAGLRRDDQVTVALTSGAHTTDSINVYFIEPFYRSTLVSYAETDDSRGRANYGNLLR